MRKIDFAGHLRKAGKVFPSRPSNPDDIWLDRTQLWLNTVRESSYRVVGAAAREGVLYETSPLLPVLAETCFSGLQYAKANHLSLFLKLVVNPFVQYSPRSQAGMTMVTEVMAFFYGFLGDFLAAAWIRNDECQFSEHPRTGSPDKSSNNEGMLQEIVEDTLLRNLSNDIMHHLNSVFADLPQPKGGASSGISQEFGPTAHAILSSPECATAALTMVCNFLSWNNSVTSQLAATMLAGAMPRLVKYPQFRSFFEGPLLAACIEGLAKHGIAAAAFQGVWNLSV